MLPMGSIMAGSMLLAVIFAVDLKGYNVLQKLPKPVLRLVASFVMLSGLWNVLWYASQHFGEFWGNAAFVSGLLMIITSFYLFGYKRGSSVLWKVKPLVLLLLLGCSVLYSYTIYNL